MEKERELKILAGDNLESIVYTLLAAKAKGEHVFCNFNDCILHSDTVSMDSAYLAVTGKSKAEFDKEREKLNKEYEEREKELQMQALKKIPTWVEQGEKFIFKEKRSEWIQCVVARSIDLYHGMELDATLEIMQALEDNATIEQTIQILNNQQHSGTSQALVRNIILQFSKRGPEFFEATAYGEIEPHMKKIIETKRQENIQLAQQNTQETFAGPQR